MPKALLYQPYQRMLTCVISSNLPMLGNLSASELKKLKNKQRKAQKKAAEEKAAAEEAAKRQTTADKNNKASGADADSEVSKKVSWL